MVEVEGVAGWREGGREGGRVGTRGKVRHLELPSAE